ncbi:MAG: SGNH/GDSL hydrolase family protein [bacterium]
MLWRSLVFWFLFPWIIPQALSVRKHAIRFAAANGEKSGVVGKGKVIKLLAIGDSIIAGVGAKTLDKALVGQFASCVADKLACRVEWKAVGKIGARTDQISNIFTEMPKPEADYILVSGGVNDLTALRGIKSWQNSLAALLDNLQAQYPDAKIIVLGIPPLAQFPLLPEPMRYLFGFRGDSYCLAAREQIQKYPSVTYVQLSFDNAPELFSEDGFHPSEAGYELIADHMADLLFENG